jgi:DNA-binding IclR family transcriptional regulator
VAGGLQPETAATPGELLLRDGLREIAVIGSATSEGELVPGSVTVAVPIFQDSEIVGSLAVVGPASRCGLAWRTRTRRLLSAAADSLTAALTAPERV